MKLPHSILIGLIFAATAAIAAEELPTAPPHSERGG